MTLPTGFDGSGRSRNTSPDTGGSGGCMAPVVPPSHPVSSGALADLVTQYENILEDIGASADFSGHPGLGGGHSLQDHPAGDSMVHQYRGPPTAVSHSIAVSGAGGYGVDSGYGAGQQYLHDQYMSGQYAAQYGADGTQDLHEESSEDSEDSDSDVDEDFDVEAGSEDGGSEEDSCRSTLHSRASSTDHSSAHGTENDGPPHGRKRKHSPTSTLADHVTSTTSASKKARHNNNNNIINNSPENDINNDGDGAVKRSKASKKRRRKPAGSQAARQRQAANMRERRRMLSINVAFDSLRQKIPTLPYEKRLSKVDTLRLAINYIHFLAEISTSAAGGPAAGRRTRPVKEVKKVIIHCQKTSRDASAEDTGRHSLSWRDEKNQHPGPNGKMSATVWTPGQQPSAPADGLLSPGAKVPEVKLSPPPLEQEAYAAQGRGVQPYASAPAAKLLDEGNYHNNSLNTTDHNSNNNNNFENATNYNTNLNTSNTPNHYHNSSAIHNVGNNSSNISTVTTLASDSGGRITSGFPASAASSDTGGRIMTGFSASVASSDTGGRITAGFPASAASSVTGGRITSGFPASAASSDTGGRITSVFPASAASSDTAGRIAAGFSTSAASSDTGGRITSGFSASAAASAMTPWLDLSAMLEFGPSAHSPAALASSCSAEDFLNL